MVTDLSLLERVTKSSYLVRLLQHTSQAGGLLPHCLSSNDDVYPFFHSIYNSSLCAYLITSPFLLYSVLPSACPPFIYTIILEFFYTLYLTPATFVFCIVFYSFQNCILLLFVFTLPTPFSFILHFCRHRFISRFLEIMRWILHSFVRALQLFTCTGLRHMNYQDKHPLMPIYRLFTVQALALELNSPEVNTILTIRYFMRIKVKSE